MRRLLVLLLVLVSLLPAAARTYAATPTLQLVVDPDDGVAPLVSFIAAAHHTLDGEIYELTSKPVEAALEDAASRGVTVRINIEEHPEGASKSIPQDAYSILAAHHVQVRWTSSMFTYTHAKYLVEDGSRAWIGTMNWSTAAFTGNREFAIIDTDPAVVKESEAIFTADWAHQRYTGAEGAVVASPDNSRSQIEAVITGAKHTLDIYAEEMGDTAIAQSVF